MSLANSSRLAGTKSVISYSIVYSFNYAQTLLLSRIWLFEAKEIESLLFENIKKIFEWEVLLCFVYNFVEPQLA